MRVKLNDFFSKYFISFEWIDLDDIALLFQANHSPNYVNRKMINFSNAKRLTRNVCAFQLIEYFILFFVPH